MMDEGKYGTVCYECREDIYDVSCGKYINDNCFVCEGCIDEFEERYGLNND